jgi:RimJ/RimL family protein N-acetyltransferase
MGTGLRKAAEADALLLAAWRNQNAAAFPYGPPVTAASHARWWRDRYVNDPWDHLYVVTEDGRPAGTVGYRPDTGETGRVLLGDKSLARTGVMSRALALLDAGYGPGPRWLRVLEGNTAAIAFYESNGYAYAGPAGDGMLVMRRETGT